MTQHKSKWIGPSQREAGICRGARARFWNRDKLHFERYTFIVNVTTKRWRYLPCYTHYRRFPNRMVKFILPLHQQASIHGLLETTSASNIHQVPGGVLFAINFDLVCIKHGTGHPGEQPFSREWGAESTPLENNPPSMEHTDNPSWYVSYSSIQNRMFIWRFRVWHIQIYLERQVDIVYR